MRIFPTLLLLFITLIGETQELPLGYISYFESDFSKKELSEDVFISRGTTFNISDGELHLTDNEDSNGYFLPSSVSFIDNNIFGEYIAEARIKYSKNISDSLEGIYFIVALRDTDNYYFVQLNEQATNFYRVYKGELVRVNSDSTFRLPSDKWLDIRIERDMLNRTIRIKYNGSSSVFSDSNLVMGYFGFGAQKYSLYIDHLTVWAPTSIEQAIPLRK